MAGRRVAQLRPAAGSKEGRESPRAAVDAVPRQLLTRKEAAASLGMSVDSFERHVQPYVKIVKWGRGKGAPVLVSPRELERWVRENERYAV